MADSLSVRLAEGLRGRVGEIQGAITERVFAVSGVLDDDMEYLAGLRSAIAAAIEHGLEALECSPDRPPRVPVALIAQARLAARMEVPLDTVLRRYMAGYTVLLDFFIAEAAESAAFDRSVLQDALRRQSLVHEQVLAVVGEEYARELQPRAESTADRRAAGVKRLLKGEPFDTSSLDYEFDTYLHTGLVVCGAVAEDSIRELAERWDCRQLVIAGPAGASWGWLGSREPIDTMALVKDAIGLTGKKTTVAVAESACALSGWRLTHRQARAAMAVAMRRKDRSVRYIDVALIASLLQNELLAESLKSTYLDPLAKDRDGGEAARKMLRAYFKAERNVSSAAAALGMNRQTVTKRLRAIDERLGGALGERGADLEVALGLQELTPLSSRI